jgi:hypothetical protein
MGLSGYVESRCSLWSEALCVDFIEEITILSTLVSVLNLHIPNPSKAARYDVSDPYRAVGAPPSTGPSPTRLGRDIRGRAVAPARRLTRGSNPVGRIGLIDESPCKGGSRVGNQAGGMPAYSLIDLPR